MNAPAASSFTAIDLDADLPPIAGALDGLAAQAREARLLLAVGAVDEHGEIGPGRLADAALAEAAKPHADVLLPMAALEPFAAPALLDTAGPLVFEHGVCGFRFQPAAQGFYPNDRRCYPLYEAIAATGMPAVFRLDGGRQPGSQRHADPLYLDALAADFPGLEIVVTRAGRTGLPAVLAVACSKTNVTVALPASTIECLTPDALALLQGPLRERCVLGSGGSAVEELPAQAPERLAARNARNLLNLQRHPVHGRYVRLKIASSLICC